MNTTTSPRPNAPQRPWYREPWPWILLGLPGTVVVASLLTFYIAVHYSDALVVEDYYKEGLAINRTLDRQQAARRLGLSGALSIEGGGASLMLTSNPDYALPARLRLHIAHPTNAAQDQNIVLERVDGGYRGVMHPAAAGRWQFLIEDEARVWRISATGKLPAVTPLTLTPDA